MRRTIVQNHLDRNHIVAFAEDGLLPGTIRVHFPLQSPPRISILIPTRDRVGMLETCLQSLIDPTDYPDLEILVIDHGSTESRTCAYLEGLRQLNDGRIRVLDVEGKFNLAAFFNHATKQATRDLVLFMHDDVRALHRDWLWNLAALCQQPGTGAAGGRLLLPEGTLDQGWIVPLRAGVAPPPFHDWPLEAPDAYKRLHVEQEVPAIGSACLLVRRDIFIELGGFDEKSFPTGFADIDFCLRLRQAGHKILWTPYATLSHDTDHTLRGGQNANLPLLQKWRGKLLVNDPLVNPWMSLTGEDESIETLPEFLPDPVSWHAVPRIAALAGSIDGSGEYRLIQPARAAHETGLARIRSMRGYPLPAIFERMEIETLFSQRQVDDEQIENLALLRQASGCRVVMDFDDLLTHVPDYSCHKKTVWPDMERRLHKVCGLCDRITVSTLPLAEYMRTYHDNIVVVPNSIDPNFWRNLRTHRRSTRKPRIGWVGGVGHTGDLAVIRDVVRILADEVEWVFMGLQLKEISPYISEFHPGVSFKDYPAAMAGLGLELGLAPLELNPFNECKSNLRILEYGALGIPVIATDISPYQGDFPITRVKNRPSDWIRAIREHLADRDEMIRLGESLREKIMDEWLLEQRLPDWVKAWTA